MIVQVDEIKTEITYRGILTLNKREAIAFRHLGDCVSVESSCDYPDEVRTLLQKISHLYALPAGYLKEDL